MPISLLFDLANYTPADASPVQSNFQQIENYLNTEVITRDGLVAMTAQLRLVNSNPVNVLDAASKGYVDSIFPVGMVIPFAGSVVPAGRWLACDGSAVSRTTYAALFAVIATQYGAGDGSTTFNLPDARGRVLTPVRAGQAQVDTVGETGGEYTHTMTVAEVRQHTHPIDHNHPAFASGAQSADHTHDWGATTSAGGSHTHGYSRRDDVPGLFVSVTGSSAVNATILNGADTGGISNTHSHNVSGTTTGVSASHTHTVDPPNFTGDSGNNTGSANTPFNVMQPYLVLGPCLIRY